MAMSEKRVAALRLANEARTGAGAEGQQWWDDEPVTVSQVKDLALKQMHAYLSRPNTKESTRLKLIQIAVRLDTKGEPDLDRKERLQTLIDLSRGTTPKPEDEQAALDDTAEKDE